MTRISLGAMLIAAGIGTVAADMMTSHWFGKFRPKASEKKADVVEHPQVFDHVGLLVNEPPGTAGLLFI